MRILHQTPDRLVLELRPLALLILCLGLAALFAAIGFGMPALIARLVPFAGAAGQVPGIGLLGYAAILPLLVAAVLLKTRRLTFDRNAGRVTLAARGLFGRSETSHDLAAFRGALLQRNRRAGNNSTTYTALLHFADPIGTVPVTPYGTGGSEPARTVEAINDWFGPQVLAGQHSMTLTGDQADQVLAALGLRPRR